MPGALTQLGTSVKEVPFLCDLGLGTIAPATETKYF